MPSLKKAILAFTLLGLLLPVTFSFARERSRGGGLVLLEALRRKPEGRHSELIFSCHGNMTRNDFYVFDFPSHRNFGFAKVDEQYSCEPIEWDEIARRHTCLYSQMRQAEDNIARIFSENPNSKVRVHIRSQNGETQWQESWTDTLADWISPSTAAYAGSEDCDLQVVLSLDPVIYR